MEKRFHVTWTDREGNAVLLGLDGEYVATSEEEAKRDAEYDYFLDRGENPEKAGHIPLIEEIE